MSAEALWLKQGRALMKDGRYEGVAGAGAHDLPQLAVAAALSLSEMEIDVLRRLSHFIEYGGRYPIPRNPDKMRLTRGPQRGTAAATTWATPSDNECFDALILRLDGLLS